MRVVAMAVALVALAGCSADGIPRGDAQRAPARIERQLPIDLVLANLCPGTETPPRLVRRLRREAEVLLQQAREHPGWHVRFTYHDAHGGSDEQEISIRQLAREHLTSIDDHPGPCEPDLRRRLAEVVE